MAAPDLSGLIQIGHAVLTTVVNQATAKILAQLGDMRGAAESDNAEWWQHVGFASRPSVAVPDKAAAQAVVIKGGDRDTCIASQDSRGVELYGLMKEGETTVYAAGGDGLSQGRTLYKADGSITTFTKEANLKAGDSIYARVATGMDARGMPDGFTWSAPWGTKKFDHTGFHVLHDSGASFDLGGITLPSPLNLLGSYVKIKAATVSIESTAMSHGDGVTPVDALAKSTPTTTALVALQAQVTALGAALVLMQAHLVAISTLPVVLGPLILALPTAQPCLGGVATAGPLCVAGLLGTNTQCALMPSTFSSA